MINRAAKGQGKPDKAHTQRDGSRCVTVLSNEVKFFVRREANIGKQKSDAKCHCNKEIEGETGKTGQRMNEVVRGRDTSEGLVQ